MSVRDSGTGRGQLAGSRRHLPTHPWASSYGLSTRVSHVCRRGIKDAPSQNERARISPHCRRYQDEWPHIRTKTLPRADARRARVNRRLLQERIAVSELLAAHHDSDIFEGAREFTILRRASF